MKERVGLGNSFCESYERVRVVFKEPIGQSLPDRRLCSTGKICWLREEL